MEANRKFTNNELKTIITSLPFGWHKIIRAVKRLIFLIVLIACLIFLITHYRGFNAPFLCYVFQFIYVPFADRRHQAIAVER